MTQESIDDVINPDRMPFAERMAFQVLLIQKMIGTDFQPKSKEKFKAEMDWAEQYARKVSEIIDNRENEELRNLIFEERYAEACELIIPTLRAQNKENIQHADAA